MKLLRALCFVLAFAFVGLCAVAAVFVDADDPPPRPAAGLACLACLAVSTGFLYLAKRADAAVRAAERRAALEPLIRRVAWPEQRNVEKTPPRRRRKP